MMTKKLIYITFLIGFVTHAQQPIVAETLAKVETYYKTTKIFNLNVVYTMYKGYTGTHLTESYKGSIYKNDAVTQLKILGSEILQFPEVQLTINNEDKTLAYNMVSDNNMQKSPLDVSAFLAFYKEASTQVSETTIIHEMILKNQQISIPYGKIIIHVNKDDYSLKKQVLYFSAKMPFINEEGKNTEDLGRMEITFQPNQSPIKKTPQLQDYIIFDVDKKPSLSEAYVSYTIIDQTNL